MLCSTPSDHAYNDWLNVSPTDYDSSHACFIFSPFNSNEKNDVTDISLHYVYPLENDNTALHQEPVLSEVYPMSILPAHSTSNDTGKTLMHLLGPLTPTPAVRRPSSSSPYLDSHCIMSPINPRTINYLEDTPFDDCYRLSTPLVSADSYISPIVRASSCGSAGDNVSPCTSNHTGISTALDFKESSFLDRLRASLPLASSPDRIQTYSSKPSSLLSPCNSSIEQCLAISPVTPKRQILPGLSNNSDVYFAAMEPLSPLTPLTPLPEGVICYQRSKSNDTTTKRRLVVQDSPSPHRPNKARRILRSSHPEPEQLCPSIYISRSSVPESPSPSPASRSLRMPIFTNRTFPSSVPISSDFPMFYRRFPASSYFQEPSLDSLKLRHPGGVFNPPRWPLDLYTPRFVKGKGTAKMGLCPICIEHTERGGENAKMWLAMKFSAFKASSFQFVYHCAKVLIPSYSYHMQYTHGISASTGLPFSPPVAYRRTKRLEVGKKEKHVIQEGKCHKCKKWVAVEGIKDMESKVKEIFWWKHAASCHHGSIIAGESREDVYERDHIYKKLLGLSDRVGT